MKPTLLLGCLLLLGGCDDTFAVPDPTPHTCHIYYGHLVVDSVARDSLFQHFPIDSATGNACDEYGVPKDKWKRH